MISPLLSTFFIRGILIINEEDDYGGTYRVIRAIHRNRGSFKPPIWSIGSWWLRPPERHEATDKKTSDYEAPAGMASDGVLCGHVWANSSNNVQDPTEFWPIFKMNQLEVLGAAVPRKSGWWWLEPWNGLWPSIQLGIIGPQVTKSIIFQRGGLKPPTSNGHATGTDFLEVPTIYNAFF
jgi:hypothetical protein